MYYLFIQTLFWLVLALLVGIVLGWLLRGVFCGGQAEASAPVEGELAKSNASEIEVSDEMRPLALNAPTGAADDLKRISGVGPVIEKTLNGLGIYHFSQIADFTEENVQWVNNYLDFPGRIEREDWLDQAKKLAK